MLDAKDTAERLLADGTLLDRLAAPLADGVAAEVVERLKQEADRHWWISARRSLELADLIVRIGQARGDARQTALGLMARGDALRFLSQLAAAWQALGEAGALFQSVCDTAGWARTRIGRLGICVDLGRVAEALEDAAQARALLTRHGEYEKRMRLDLNIASVYYQLGDQRQALRTYLAALAEAEALIEAGQAGDGFIYTTMGMLYNNIAITYDLLGDFRQSLAYHERARALFAARGETRALALAELNSAHIEMAQGHHRRALQLLHRAHEHFAAERLELDAANASNEMVECYLLLNRYAEARDLARQVIASYRAAGTSYREGLALLHLATAEAELADVAEAQAALDRAGPIFAALGAGALIATVRLRGGQIALKRGLVAQARSEAALAGAAFAADGQQVNYAAALLLQGQALLAEGDIAAADAAGAAALRIARGSNTPPLRYSAHLLLGHAAERQGRHLRAARRYGAALATVERAQRGLTITLRPGFLEDKGEAHRALIGLHLRAGRAERALAALERTKSQALLGYLANRESLRWIQDDGHSRALIEELERLREEHQWFYRLAHQPAAEEGQAPACTPQQALLEVAARERRMRAITEHLYLNSGARASAGPVAGPTLPDIQQRLAPDELLIEFYNDGRDLWAFTLDRDSLAVQHLPTSVAALDQMLGQLQTNLSFALNSGPTAPTAPGLFRLAQRLLQRLHAALHAPLAERAAGRSRLTVVPYGALHYLPYHLLHSGAGYLIEQHEVVVLPTAGLATRPGLARPRAARVLAHSWGGRLPRVADEAALVQRLFGGELHAEQAARRAVLQEPPTQVLHIAAHGEHRLDQPDLSYIQLADGQLYTDDLLQQDMGYELVTLSACETGRANVAAGDELIGLGRGFLYAGAGALITSLWRVDDASAGALMLQFYERLLSGASKAAALRAAQVDSMSESPQLHPAFWGAFQLVGDARPLSETI